MSREKTQERAWRALCLAVATAMVVAMTALVSGGAASARSDNAAGNMSPVVAKSDQGTMRSKINYRSADGWFKGKFVPTSFAVEDGQVVAHGVLKGLVHKKGEATKKVTQAVELPVLSATGGGGMGGGKMAAMAPAGQCDVLNLVLGPLDLNLLGLEIHLDTVVLDIIANPAGGLLGDLLCGVANLLSGGPIPGLLAQISGLLNQILGALGGLGA
jgi:hypothetical protein